ncbi:enoyl-CoA hydratase/isomerase family protein [Marinobacter sp. 71-i]|uniref:Enoyl-CoA hydratase/isomerase family protein n=1 Tax=Marinobacter iranensis TaxID=2962607 RepID=A0ABT5YAX5_9GAMM|nr:enoyl-CoA hydratase/isomerase family protein [Marinobacter iranensis]MDF0750839.1 enoyl-CoA hydratase/isomerase family protein [Marinobacter iranensis]
METETLKLEWPEKDVALLTLQRGKEMNTLTQALLSEFNQALDIMVEKGCRALIITGTGRAFCCGAHLDYFFEDQMDVDARFRLRDDYLDLIARLFDRLEVVPFPVIAAINGYALGGGCEMTLSCDFRIMSKETRLGLPEVRLGALAGAGGVQKLSRHVGRSKAMEWILLGSHIDAEEADRHGLLYKISEPGEEVIDALTLVQKLKEQSPLAIMQSKRAILTCEDVDLRSARRFGLEALSMLIDSKDWAEGIAAFQAKRPPKFD